MRKKIIVAAVLCLSMLLGQWCAVYADDTQTEAGCFSGDVRLLRQEEDSYVLQVTAENTGEDFSGIIQLILVNADKENCAYNTQIALPSGSKKQYTLSVPVSTAETVRGICTMRFLDEDGNVVGTISLRDIYGDTAAGIPVGVWSDNYSDISYMDISGMGYYIGSTAYPLELVQLSEDNLAAYLDGLYFMIIDQFDMSSLSDENIQSIQDWVNDGGWLIVGTGAYALQTLGGFDADFLGLEVTGISEPGESNYVSVNESRYDYYYYSYTNDGIDFTNMSIAELNDAGSNVYYNESSENPALCASIGDGAVSVFAFSFGESEMRKADTSLIDYIYEEVMYNSASWNTYADYTDMDFVGVRALSAIDSEHTDVDFSWLKILIGCYVVLAGPVLYLILRKCKKSEWYWLAVPALGIVFIGGVFAFGQGIRVNETKVYSVTTQRADSSQINTYYMAYHSGIAEWRMLLADNYETGGPVCYYYGNSLANDEYHYVIQTDSDGLSIGLAPQENFESAYLFAQGTKESMGSIRSENLTADDLTGKPAGAFTNDTSSDMAYMCVLTREYVMIFSDVKAGETLDIEQAEQDNRCVYQTDIPYFDDLSYTLTGLTGYYGYNELSEEESKADVAALLIGLCEASDALTAGGNNAVIAGVVSDYDKTVVGCDEVSYGCLYTVTDLEVDENAAD